MFWSLTGFPRASLPDLDESMSDLCFEKDNIVFLTNVCKMYILNTKQILTNSISRLSTFNMIFSIIIDDPNTKFVCFRSTLTFNMPKKIIDRLNPEIRLRFVFVSDFNNRRLTVAILMLSDKRLIETDLLKTGFLFY
jgi:hypothetical protein